MKFDPDYFLKIAQRNGVELSLNSEGKIYLTSNGKPASVLWVIAAKKHKRKLLSHLKQQQVRYTQTDLFACRD